MADAAFEALYGPWSPLHPTQVADWLGDFDGPWWIAGGWAVEAFSGVAREHEDVDVCLFRRDLPRLRTAFAGRAHLWSAGSGSLRPLDDDFPDLPPGAEQVWVREHASAPWVADVLLNPDRDGRWVNRRHPAHEAPLAEVTWVGDDGVRYLQPEVALLFKARQDRPKDRADLAAALPRLDVRRRAWLREHLAAVEPGHPWQEQLA